MKQIKLKFSSYLAVLFFLGSHPIPSSANDPTDDNDGLFLIQEGNYRSPNCSIDYRMSPLSTHRGIGLLTLTSLHPPLNNDYSGPISIAYNFNTGFADYFLPCTHSDLNYQVEKKIEVSGDTTHVELSCGGWTKATYVILSFDLNTESRKIISLNYQSWIASYSARGLYIPFFMIQSVDLTCNHLLLD